jgi:hypothetical protein
MNAGVPGENRCLARLNNSTKDAKLGADSGSRGSAELPLPISGGCRIDLGSWKERDTRAELFFVGTVDGPAGCGRG